MHDNRVAMEPKRFAPYEQAVVEAGGALVRLDSSVKVLIWTDYAQPQLLRETLDANPQLEWVQLPFAGVDAFVDVLQRDITFTCAKGSFAEPVAEHALALTLALARKIPTRVRATTWGAKFAFSLFEANVLILGGGGITEQLVDLLTPFRANITVLRKHPQAMNGVRHVDTLESLNARLADADVVILALSLTSETEGLFDLPRFEKMKPTAYFVNIARGRHVVLDGLIKALDQGFLPAQRSM